MTYFPQLLPHLTQQRDAMVALLSALVAAESPSDAPETQAGPQASLRAQFAQLGYAVEHTVGAHTGAALRTATRSKPCVRSYRRQSLPTRSGQQAPRACMSHCTILLLPYARPASPPHALRGPCTIPKHVQQCACCAATPVPVDAW